MLTVLQFWNHYGADNIRRHIHSQAKEAGTIYTSNEGTPLSPLKQLSLLIVGVLPI